MVNYASGLMKLVAVEEMANQVVELATKKEESYRGRVNNLSQASHVLGVLRHKFNDAHLANFRASYFGHLDNVDKLTFSGQLMHELSIRRGVKDLKGLTYLISCEVTGFTKKDFCLITGLHCNEPYDLDVEPSNIRLLLMYFPQKFGFVGESSKGKGKGVKGKGKVKIALKKATKKVLVTCVDLEMRTWISSTLIHGVWYRSNNYMVASVLLLLGEGEEDGMVMRNEMRKMKRNNRWEVRGGRDLDGATKSLVWAYEKIAQLEKPLCYCKMTDPATIPRIPRWSTNNK
ncbi:hypothetical protein DVH24_019816 [Malus domestica]|uniref:Uncharacterized protein n=1 Tax=Malus domestica TaxID=3750 RepID=A0A498HZ89_MALDO|nr:hypothetical protein DVH24_019816 [Malus domestica]